MEPGVIDTSVRVDAGALNKLVSFASELLAAREQFRAVHDRVAGAQPVADERPPAPTALVLFATPDEGRMAIPLASVDRIEEFDAGAVFDKGLQRVVRYRGRILPLVEVSGVLPERRGRLRRSDAPGEASPRRVQVIVHTHAGCSVGLIVDRLLDIVEEPLELAQPSSRTGARSSVVVRDRVTEIVDLEAMRRSVSTASGEAPAPGSSGG